MSTHTIELLKSISLVAQKGVVTVDQLQLDLLAKDVYRIVDTPEIEEEQVSDNKEIEVKTDQVDDYFELTSQDLKNLLNARGIKYPSKADKKTLTSILASSDENVNDF